MATMDELGAENARLKEELDQLQIQVAESTKKINELTYNNAQNYNDIEWLREQNSKLQTGLAQSAKYVQQLDSQKNILTDKIRELNKEKDQLTRENDRVGAASNVADYQLGKLRSELTQANNDIERSTTAAKKEVHEARKDLIRRFIAIAISVGVGGQIVTNKAIDQWANWTTIPGIHDPLWETVFRLFTSMLVILLAWDWYDRDLKNKPLTRIARFILDAIIVSAELVLLLSASYPRLWADVLLVILMLYLVWDVLSIIDHPDAFGFAKDRAKWWYAPGQILCTYVGGLDPLKRGPPINLTWFAYFVIVLVVLPRLWPIRMYGDSVTCLMIILGSSLLWCEGVRRKDGKTRLISFSGRIVAFVLLGTLYVLLWNLLT